jgi:hypothetical protein
MNKQKFIFAVILAAILISGTHTGIVTAENTDDEVTQMEQVKYEHKAIKPHFNFYYQLLAEKYAPKHVKVWNEVIREREALFKKYRELSKSGKDIGNFYDEDWLKAHNDIHQKFLAAVEKRDDDALKMIVPQVIDHQKELNSLLKKRLKEIK